jgi:hypothetical protein
MKVLSDAYKRLSESYGKGMIIAAQYYGRLGSIGYDPAMADQILYKSIYIGDATQLYRFAMKVISGGSGELLPTATRCLKLSARMGDASAVAYCSEHGIDIDLM